MPIYEYRCRACDHPFEQWQRMSDPPVRVCPRCGKRQVEKLLSASAFQLKGGGWYKDGYAAPRPKTSSESKAKEKSGG
jgi:putative FmdB family regulatory protein